MDLPKVEMKEDYGAKLAAIPVIASCGKLFSSSKPVKLTEEETEYMCG